MIDGLSRLIEKSIGVQPFVRSISVTIDREMVDKKQNPGFGYCELEGRMLQISIQVLYKNVIAHVQMCYDEEKDYPLMSLKKIEEI
jgi:hypothetical protein